MKILLNNDTPQKSSDSCYLFFHGIFIITEIFMTLKIHENVAIIEVGCSNHCNQG